MAAKLANHRNLPAQPDKSRSHDDRAGEPVAVRQHEDPEHDETDERHSQRSRSSHLTIEVSVIHDDLLFESPPMLAGRDRTDIRSKCRVVIRKSMQIRASVLAFPSTALRVRWVA